MTPLEPLHGKSFATTISPWVVTLDALEPFKIPAAPRNPDIVLPSYLQDSDPLPAFEIELKAGEICEVSNGEREVECAF